MDRTNFDTARLSRALQETSDLQCLQDPVDGEQGSTSNKPQPHPAADVPPETLHLHVRNLQTSLEQNEDQEVSPIKLLVSVDT